MMPSDRAQVLIVGTYHMANPNSEYIKSTYGDVRTATRQQQVEGLAQQLSTFRPTHVAIEREPANMARVLARYQEYRSGKRALEPHEWEQLGFRIADSMSHDRLYGIDYQAPLDFERAISYAGDTGVTKLIEEIQSVLAEMTERAHQLEAQGSLFELFQYLNDVRRDELDHSLYIRLAPLGAGEQYVGANLLADWYGRNLKIFANIARLAVHPGDRIFVLVGAGHRRLLRQFVLDSPHLELVDPLPYLQERR